MTKPLPEGKIEIWDVDKLVPYEKNAKKHEPAQVQKLVALIQRYGWTQPIVVQKATGSIIAGHGRRLAALEMGLKKVPVNVLDVTDEEARALRLSDNRVTSTDYDASLVQQEIYDLKDLGFDVHSMGFDVRELDFLAEDVSLIDESVFAEDISQAVETQKDTNANHQAKIDEQEAPLAKSFGFKRMTVAQGRRVRAFMDRIETDFGVTGVAALMAHFDDIGVK